MNEDILLEYLRTCPAWEGFELTEIRNLRPLGELWIFDMCYKEHGKEMGEMNLFSIKYESYNNYKKSKHE